MAQTYLTPDDLVERLNGTISKKTLANWRSGPIQQGPRFRRFGNRILYPMDAVLEWELSREFRSTREYESPDGADEPASPPVRDRPPRTPVRLRDRRRARRGGKAL